MYKFWKWMEEKDYGIDYQKENFKEYLFINTSYHPKSVGKPTKQMLIGYMMEYLIYNGHDKLIKSIDDIYDEMVNQVVQIVETKHEAKE